MKTKYIIILILMLSVIFSGCLNNPENIQQNTNAVSTPILTPTPIPTPTQSKFISTYTDYDGNLHQVEDYTSQGGGKYDTIIKNIPIQTTNIPIIISTFSENSKQINVVSDTKDAIISWIDKNKPQSGFNDKTKEIESFIYKKVNEERSKLRLGGLRLDSTLSEIARQHSLDMIRRDFFEHENPDGQDPTTRATEGRFNVHKELGGGWYSDGIGENIGEIEYGYVSSPESVAQAMMEGWMSSPGHKRNILDSDYDVIGVVVAYDGYGNYLLTQDFW